MGLEISKSYSYSIVQLELFFSPFPVTILTKLRLGFCNFKFQTFYERIKFNIVAKWEIKNNADDANIFEMVNPRAKRGEIWDSGGT